VSLGNRGSDVRAAQALLLVRGQPAVVTGIFDSATRDAVRGYQASHGLAVTGVVDAATWRSLTPAIKQGSTGHGVRAVQRLLNEKRKAGLTVDGVYGSATRRAVAAFQKHLGVTVTGTMTEATWRRLLWHYELPVWSHGLCDYSVGNGAANWATGSAIGQLEAAARRMRDAGYARLAIGDIGFEHGGDIPGHVTHEQGLDIDIRPMRDNRDQCARGTNYRLASYNRKATRALIKAIRATAPGHVKLVFFNDPVLIGEGLTRRSAGHDDHIHVRYCEASHPRTAYRCAPASLATTGAGRSFPARSGLR
jgi:hypothetical protein